MSLPAIAETTDLATTEDDLPISCEYLLTLRPEEASHEPIGKSRKNSLFRWVTVLNTVRAGHPMNVAAADAGIATRTMQGWLERGRAGEYPYTALLEAMEVCMAFAEKRHLDNIMDTALPDENGKGGNWTASAWYLERTRGYTRRQETKQHEDRPKEFPIIIDQSGKIAERAEERDAERKAIEVESRIAADD